MKSRVKTWEEVASLDFLSWEDVIIYVRGLGRNSLNSARRRNELPKAKVAGKWSRYDLDAWMGKGQEVRAFDASEEEELGEAAKAFRSSFIEYGQK